MKKRLLILLFALLLSLSLAACGGEPPTDSGEPSAPSASSEVGGAVEASDAPAGTDGKLNPPAWLAGKWSDGSETVEADAHNVTVSNGSLDFTWQIENVGLDVKESTDGDAYQLEYESGGVQFVYVFEKQSDGTMKRTVSMGGIETSSDFTKQ